MKLPHDLVVALSMVLGVGDLLNQVGVVEHTDAAELGPTGVDPPGIPKAHPNVQLPRRGGRLR